MFFIYNVFRTSFMRTKISNMVRNEHVMNAGILEAEMFIFSVQNGPLNCIIQ